MRVKLIILVIADIAPLGQLFYMKQGESVRDVLCFYRPVPYLEMGLKKIMFYANAGLFNVWSRVISRL